VTETCTVAFAAPAAQVMVPLAAAVSSAAVKTPLGSMVPMFPETDQVKQSSWAMRL